LLRDGAANWRIVVRNNSTDSRYLSAHFAASYDQLQLTWEQAILQASKYYPFAEEHTPRYRTMRLIRANHLLHRAEKHSPETLQGILGDHVNGPHGICAHTVPEDPPLDRQKTICSLIMDLTTLAMHACWGNPCENHYSVCQL
jgi:hypothetical protein